MWNCTEVIAHNPILSIYCNDFASYIYDDLIIIMDVYSKSGHNVLITEHDRQMNMICIDGTGWVVQLKVACFLSCLFLITLYYY